MLFTIALLDFFIQIAIVANYQFIVNTVYYTLTNQTKKIVSVTNVK